VISGIESLFRKDNLQNFIFILRSAMLWSPPYLRVLLTAESTDSSKEHFEKMLKILATPKILDVTDDLTFAAEGRQLVEFAYKLISGQRVRSPLFSRDSKNNQLSGSPKPAWRLPTKAIEYLLT
jgi:hypothetical protein